MSLCAQHLKLRADLNPAISIKKSENYFWTNLHWTRISYRSEISRNISLLLDEVNGIAILADFPEFTGLNETQVFKTFELLFAQGILLNRDNHHIPESLFHDNIVNQARTIRAIMAKDLGLHNPQTNPNTVVKEILNDTLYYIKNCTRHISIAISNISCSHKRNIFSEYFSEEYNHGPEIEKKLQDSNCSFKEKEIYPSEILIRFLCDLAERDLKSYAICLALSENPVIEGKSFSPFNWSQLQQEMMHKNLSEMIRPFEAHDRLDAECQHGDLSRLFFREDQEISAKDQKRIKKNVIYFLTLMKDVYTKSIHTGPNEEDLII